LDKTYLYIRITTYLSHKNRALKNIHKSVTEEAQTLGTNFNHFNYIFGRSICWQPMSGSWSKYIKVYNKSGKRRRARGRGAGEVTYARPRRKRVLSL
jgi:hypothetical protein